MYAIFEDDLIISRGAAAYLERTTTQPDSYFNLYTSLSNQRRFSNGSTGWTLSNQRGQGAVGLVFRRDVFLKLLSEPAMLKHAMNPDAGRGNVDGMVITALGKHTVIEYVHSPSIVQHMGDVSVMGHGTFPKATSFRGEEFDLMTLPNVPNIMPPVVPTMETVEPITVVVVAFNCCDLLKECLEHLRDYCTIPFRVIVVDNASTEPIPQVPGVDVTVICNETNRGWTAAANQGVAQADGHVLLINSDCNVGPNCVEKLHAALISGHVAAVGPLTGDGCAQSIIPRQRSPYNAVEGAMQVARNTGVREAPTLAFFCALLHRDALRELGPLDERPEFACGLGADDEWVYRSLRAGWKCLVVESAFAQHYGSSSFNRNGINRRALQNVAARELRRIVVNGGRDQ